MALSPIQAQQAAIDYLHSRSRPNDRRAPRKAARIVREACVEAGYSSKQQDLAVRDMFDIYRLESGAE